MMKCHVLSDLGWVGYVLARLRYFLGSPRSMGEIIGGFLGSQAPRLLKGLWKNF